MNGFKNGREDCFIEVYHTINVEFRTEEVEEDILTVAFERLTHRADQFIEHREALRSVGDTRYHLAHALLQSHDFGL
tara:strand:- start:234 stop:464 length:231 start_codon:yes stop_codon:yes gene_type:complete